MAFPQMNNAWMNPPEFDTNTIVTLLPKGMDEPTAKKIFKKFGDVMCLKSVPGSKSVSVSFWDVRAAKLAAEALGGARYCRPGPQTGLRTVRLHGDTNLFPEEVNGVSNLVWNADDEYGSSYTVEFYDVRGAEAVRNRIREAEASSQQEALVMPPGLEFMAAKKKQNKESHAVHPLYITPAVNKTIKGPIAVDCRSLKDVTNVEKRPSFPHQTIMVWGLPNTLCNDSCFEAMLQQAGFQGGEVIRFSCKTGKPSGEATIVLACAEAATRCKEHFEGRKWDPSGPVRAEWMVDEAVPDATSRKQRCDTATTTCSNMEGPLSDGEESR
jgi:hypothetical protein